VTYDWILVGPSADFHEIHTCSGNGLGLLEHVLQLARRRGVHGRLVVHRVELDADAEVGWHDGAHSVDNVNDEGGSLRCSSAVLVRAKVSLGR